MSAAVAPETRKARRTPRLPWRRLSVFDWKLFGASMLAIAAGSAMIYSATLRGEVDTLWEDLVVKQLVFATAGVVAMVLVAMTDYRILVATWVWIYAGMMGLLLALFTYGSLNFGSTRWFEIAGVALQPSEFAKIALIIGLAAYFDRFGVDRLRHVLGSLGLVGLAMYLVYLQPDLSTAVLLGAIWLGMAFAAGLRPLHLAGFLLVAIPLPFLLLEAGLIKQYQLDRVVYWINPEADPSYLGYQSIQTLIAVGNGGLTGTGFAGGSQAQGGWLPLPFTDNIFALLAEELGFIGGLAFLALLAFIFWRVVRAVRQAQDYAGQLIVVGVATYLLAQIFVNIGVVLQILPVTGISLPLISYGGSSLIAVMTSLGLVQSVLLRRRALEFN